jgi:hypothetical protein
VEIKKDLKGRDTFNCRKLLKQLGFNDGGSRPACGAKTM